MKETRYNISLYIIIPIITAGFALLATAISYNITLYYLKKGVDPIWPVFFWGTILVLFSSVCGLVIVRTILSPLERFFKKTESLGLFKNMPEEAVEAIKRDDISRYNQFFDQVTEILSKVESKELFPQIVGQSRAMRSVFNQIMKVAATDSTVLVLGETGTGKELIASSLHEHSKRREKPFVAINCAAIPDGLLESELFGHEKGAFTGANEKKLGKFEVASGGTIFMDEIGDMPLGTQAKLLRVIQDGLVERVGGLNPIKVDVRFVAATNKDLSQMVKEGKFREDLYFRLNVFSIHLPPLRERREDIPLLVDKFLAQHDKNMRMTTESMQLLTAYSWPGNVRELRNAVESATVLARDVIEAVHLPVAVTRSWPDAKEGGASRSAAEASAVNQAFERRMQTFETWERLDVPKSGDIDQRLGELEKELIIAALKKAGGVQVAAAKILGIKERSLWHRIKKFEIDISQFKGHSS